MSDLITRRNFIRQTSAALSGTALAAYFISFGDPTSAEALYHAIKKSCGGSLIGFGFVREYPAGISGRGDIDSGPIIFGVSPSATGFMLASARCHGDHDFFVQLYRSAHLIGPPVSVDDRHQFITGSPLGNAILLAMLTAQPARP